MDFPSRRKDSLFRGWEGVRSATVWAVEVALCGAADRRQDDE